MLECKRCPLRIQHARDPLDKPLRKVRNPQQGTGLERQLHESFSTPAVLLRLMQIALQLQSDGDLRPKRTSATLRVAATWGV